MGFGRLNVTAAKSTARATATPISRSVVGETVLMMPLTPGMDDVLVWVEDEVLEKENAEVVVVANVIEGLVVVYSGMGVIGSNSAGSSAHAVFAGEKEAWNVVGDETPEVEYSTPPKPVAGV